MNPTVVADKAPSSSDASPPGATAHTQHQNQQEVENANEATSAAARHEVAPETRFFQYFQQELTALMTQIDKLEHKSEIGGERNDAIDHCLAGISRLSKEVKEASSYVPPYHQKIYADAIKALQDKLAETRARLAPRPKFSFKNVRKRPSAMSLQDLEELSEQHARGIVTKGETPAESESASGNKDKDSAKNDRPSVIINGRKDVYVAPPDSASTTNASLPAYLTDIESSVIDLSRQTAHNDTSLPPHLATLSARGVKNSILICGRVAGAAHITAAENTVVVVGCQQLRLHDCRDIDVYLSCGSRPIIENCKGVRFARVPGVHKSQSSTPGTDLWDQVQDFNWIKTEASPNWRLLSEESIPPAEFWERLGSKEVEKSLNEVLKSKMVTQN
ncbi:Cytosolic copper metallochaperone [Ascosphaera pollenicola]|nr:Cytosolic copper metallochaperone [Ascosphaera pollenicola]